MRGYWGPLCALIAVCGAAVAGEPPGLLAPAATLDPEVVEAARFVPGDSGFDYIGAWAWKVEECPQVDLDYTYEFLAVITTKHIASFASYCTYEPKALSSGAVTLSANCANEGEEGTEDADFELSMPDPNRLTINGGEPLVRCVLPD